MRSDERIRPDHPDRLEARARRVCRSTHGSTRSGATSISPQPARLVTSHPWSTTRWLGIIAVRRSSNRLSARLMRAPRSTRSTSATRRLPRISGADSVRDGQTAAGGRAGRKGRRAARVSGIARVRPDRAAGTHRRRRCHLARRRTLVVGRGYRTNDAGIEQLKALLGRPVEVVVVPLPHWTGEGDVMHLMSLISPVDRRPRGRLFAAAARAVPRMAARRAA